MKSQSTILRNSMLLSLLSLTACPGTQTGNPVVETDLIIKASNNSAPVANNFWQNIFEILNPSSWAFNMFSIVDSNGLVVSLDHFWLSFDDIGFDIAAAEEDEEIEVEIIGPFYVNMLDSNPSPVGTFKFPKTGFQTMETRLRAGGVDAPSYVPEELHENSIWI